MTDEFDIDFSKGQVRGPLFPPGTKIEMAPQEKVQEHVVGMEQLLELLGHPEALVSDWSTLRDFAPDGVTMRVLGNTYKRILNVDEELWQLAKELEEMDDPR